MNIHVLAYHLLAVWKVLHVPPYYHLCLWTVQIGIKHDQHIHYVQIEAYAIVKGGFCTPCMKQLTGALGCFGNGTSIYNVYTHASTSL